MKQAGFANGINGYGGYGGLWSQVSGVFSSFISNVKRKFQIASPSRVFEDIGENVDLGFINGINNLSGQVDDSAVGLGESAMTSLSDYLNQASKSFSEEVQDPVIKPVLDLSEIQNGSGKIANMLDLSQYSKDTVLAFDMATFGGSSSHGNGASFDLSSLTNGSGASFGNGAYSSGLLSSLLNGSSLSSVFGGSSSGESAVSQVFNFNITPTPNQDVNAIADAVERKLTRGIKQRGASF